MLRMWIHVKVRSFQLRLWDISGPLTPAPPLNRAKALILEWAVSRCRKDSPKEKFRVVTDLYKHVSAFGVDLLNHALSQKVPLSFRVTQEDEMIILQRVS
jgi:hypothetical protein